MKRKAAAGPAAPAAPRKKRAKIAPPRIAANTFVSVECTLRDDEGELLLDEDDGGAAGKVDYVHGYGMLVPGLETALTGLVVGDGREILVPPASGYGERDMDLVLEIDRAELPDPANVAEGDEVLAEWPDGPGHVLRVIEVRPESAILDGNHPLAGMTLRYFVRVLAVRPATHEEIERAARELEESEDEAVAEAEDHAEGEGEGCGAGCSHEHAPLITLGTRKAKGAPAAAPTE